MANAGAASVPQVPLFPAFALNPCLSNVGWHLDGEGENALDMDMFNDILTDLEDGHGQAISSTTLKEVGNEGEDTQSDTTWIEVQRLIKSGKITSPKEGPWHNIFAVQFSKQQPNRSNNQQTNATWHSSTKANDGDGTSLLRPKLA